jgi:hypothetical protein
LVLRHKFFIILIKLIHMRRREKERPRQNERGRHQYPLPGEISPVQRQRNEDAHQQAERDMQEDPELGPHSPNDYLDEGETARLGEDRTDLV